MPTQQELKEFLKEQGQTSENIFDNESFETWTEDGELHCEDCECVIDRDTGRYCDHLLCLCVESALRRSCLECIIFEGVEWDDYRNDNLEYSCILRSVYDSGYSHSLTKKYGDNPPYNIHNDYGSKNIKSWYKLGYDSGLREHQMTNK
jgi:hypothetical protein